MSGSALDNNPSHPSVSTPVDTEMHKEDLQAPGNPTSLGVPSEEGANPQLSSDMYASKHNKPTFFASTIFHSESASGCDVSTDSTAELDPGLSAPNDSMPHQQDKIKSTGDALKIVHTSSGTNKELGADATSTKIKLEDRSQFMHDTRSAFLASRLPQTDEPSCLDETLLKKGLLIQILRRTSWSNKKQKLKQKLLPLKLGPFIIQIFNQLTKFWFASIMENASPKAKSKGVPSAGQTTASPAKGETNINPATKDAEKTNLHNDLVDLMGIDVVEEYHKKSYCPITLKVYKEDGTDKVISNFKVSDQYLAE
ncbi:hypothetical protein Tco_0555959 [Tanacetum coccineum]